MSELVYVDTVELPEWSLAYLEYGDATGLTDEEVKLVDEWVKAFQVDYGIVSLCYEYWPDTSGFSFRPAFGLPCQTMTAKVWGHREVPDVQT